MSDNIVKQARIFAEKHHEGYTLKNDEPYINHLDRVAEGVKSLHAPEALIAAAYLHDVFHVKRVNNKDLKKLVEESFPRDVYDIAYEVYTYSKIAIDVAQNKSSAAKWQQQLLSHPDAAVIKIIDRLDVIQDISKEQPNKEDIIAKSIARVYTTVAWKLGLRIFAFKLQDFTQRIFSPDAHNASEKILATHKKNKEIIDSHKKLLEKEFKHIPGLKVNVVRLNRLALYQRLCKVRDQMEPSDTVLFIMTTPNREGCQDLNEALVKRFYSSRDEDNFNFRGDEHYGFYHLLADKKNPDFLFFKVIVRTESMHQIAEWGVASQWISDSEEIKEGVRFIHERIRDDINKTKILDKDWKIGYTKDGKMIPVKAEASVGDFIYTMDPELGEHTGTIFVNSQEVSSDYVFFHGEMIEVKTQKRGGAIDEERDLKISTSKESAARYKDNIVLNILTQNQVGIAARIADIFFREKQDIYSFVVFSLESDYGIFHIEIYGIEATKYEKIKKLLSDTDAVMHVCTIEERNNHHFLQRIDFEEHVIKSFQEIQSRRKGLEIVPDMKFEKTKYQTLFDLLYRNRGKVVSDEEVIVCLEKSLDQKSEEPIVTLEAARKVIKRINERYLQNSRWEIKRERKQGWQLMLRTRKAN